VACGECSLLSIYLSLPTDIKLVHGCPYNYGGILHGGLGPINMYRMIEGLTDYNLSSWKVIMIANGVKTSLGDVGSLFYVILMRCGPHPSRTFVCDYKTSSAKCPRLVSATSHRESSRKSHG
jgi:hypothetical protein